MKTITEALPVIDLKGPARDTSVRRGIARQLDHAFTATGFCYITNTGVPPALVRSVFAMSRRFHALGPEEKARVSINAQHRGYMAPKTSLIETSSVAKVTQPNLSESFMVLHEVAPTDARYGTAIHGPNQWPTLPGFRAAVQQYDAAMETLARDVLRLMAVALGQPEMALDQYFNQPTTWLRLLHYPPQPVDSPNDQFGSAPHTDYGCFTILAQDEHGGLQVRTRNGQWIDATPLADTFVVNVADMLSLWSGGRWPSTPHRVVNRTSHERFSVPYFFDMDLDTCVSPLPGTAKSDGGSSESTNALEMIRYGDYVMERLNRNYRYRRQGDSKQV